MRVSEAAGGSPSDTSDAAFSIQASSGLGPALDNTALTFVPAGSAPWFAETSTTYFDGDAAQSGVIGNSQESSFSATLTGPGTLSFYWKVSSEANYDYLNVYVDGARQTGISGLVDWEQRTYPISTGTHVVKWAYVKDGVATGNADCGWVDQVEYAAPVTITGAVTAGGTGLAGVAMGGLTGNPTTDSWGVYSGTVASGWSGTVTPAKTNYAFTPPSRTYSAVVTDQIGQDYTAAAAASITFTDDPLTAGVTPIKAMHIQELRVLVGTLRARHGLGGVAWTDTSMTLGVTPVRAVHVQELRTALAEAYAAAGRTAPAFTDATIVQGASVVRAVHIAELRAAIVALW